VGRSSTEPIRGGQLPQVLTTEPWDGKDGEVTYLSVDKYQLLLVDPHDGTVLWTELVYYCHKLADEHSVL